MYHPARAAKIIYTCCVLRSIALEARIPALDEDIEVYEEANENIEDMGNWILDVYNVIFSNNPFTEQNNRNIFNLGRLARDEY